MGKGRFDIAGRCGTAAALSCIEPKVSTVRLQSHNSYSELRHQLSVDHEAG